MVMVVSDPDDPQALQAAPPEARVRFFQRKNVDPANGGFESNGRTAAVVFDIRG